MPSPRLLSNNDDNNDDNDDNNKNMLEPAT